VGARESQNAPLGLIQHAPGFVVILLRVSSAPLCIQARDVIAAFDIRVTWMRRRVRPKTGHGQLRP
jgi:hypothetical protein